MRICYVCNEYPPSRHGGIGSFTQVLAEALARAGHEVRVIGVYREDDPQPAQVHCQGVEVWRLREPTYRMGWVAARYRLYRQVAAWCRRGEVELVEVPDFEGWAAFWPALPAPVICRLNGSASYFAAEQGITCPRGLFHLERASLGRADYCCAASRYTAEHTQRVFGMQDRQFEVLHNAVEVPCCSAAAQRATNRIVFTGTLTMKKGVLSLARAWPEVLRARPDGELHLLGKDGRAPGGGSMQEYLRSQVGQHAAARMTFHGHTSRAAVHAMLHTARVAVFPSYAEAFALAPMEAMACACPTIYSRRGSGPELIRHGQDGLLIDPDRPGEIAAAILAVLDDERLAVRLGSAGKDHIEQEFAIDKLEGRNETFYAKCIHEFRRGGRRVA
jgi:glycosyltransferase involved in cell wall biosynthesis